MNNFCNIWVTMFGSNDVSVYMSFIFHDDFGSFGFAKRLSHVHY
jgi:hypothetical protein